MENPIDKKPERHLVNILKATRKHHPNFAILLGAGASVTSGIKTSQKMIDDWRDEHYQLYGNGTDSTPPTYARSVL
ncbi:MAG: hypothetical protein ACI8W8_002266 [Rhodothermales bacterium]|jgi:hypothetical protein